MEREYLTQIREEQCLRFEGPVALADHHARVQTAVENGRYLLTRQRPPGVPAPVTFVKRQEAASST